MNEHKVDFMVCKQDFIKDFLTDKNIKYAKVSYFGNEYDSIDIQMFESYNKSEKK